jgi:hypothetical protein
MVGPGLRLSTNTLHHLTPISCHGRGCRARAGKYLSSGSVVTIPGSQPLIAKGHFMLQLQRKGAICSALTEV